MRLVDADVAIKAIEDWYESEDADVFDGEDIVENIRKVPTVQAIPIEWIENYMSEISRYDEHAKPVLGAMVLNWLYKEETK